MLRWIVGLLLVSSFAHAAERDVVRTFPVLPGCTVAIDTFRGSILVTEADTTEIRVAVHLEIGADSEAEAEQMTTALDLRIAADGAVVSITAPGGRNSGPRFVWNDKKQIEPTYRITVPQRCDLDLRTRTGSIVVGHVTGALRAYTGKGDVFFRVVGGMVDAHTAAGDVVVSRCVGTLKASTQAGTIRVGTVSGACRIRNGSGDVELLAAKADVTAEVDAGALVVGFPADFSGTAELRTDGGAILARVHADANCRIEATTTVFSRVENSLPLQVEVGRDRSRRLVGRLGDGRSKIALHASGGNVKLVPAE